MLTHLKSLKIMRPLIAMAAALAIIGTGGGCEYRVVAGRVVRQMICEENKPNCFVNDVR